MTTERTGGFKHGTAETWIVGVVSAVLLAFCGWFLREQASNAREQAAKFDDLKDRFIRVESKVESVHLSLVDIPNMKLEQARMDLRLQQVEAQQRAAERARSVP